MDKRETLEEIEKYISEIASSEDAMSYRNQVKMAFLTAMCQELAKDNMGKTKFLA